MGLSHKDIIIPLSGSVVFVSVATIKTLFNRRRGGGCQGGIGDYLWRHSVHQWRHASASHRCLSSMSRHSCLVLESRVYRLKCALLPVDTVTHLDVRYIVPYYCLIDNANPLILAVTAINPLTPTKQPVPDCVKPSFVIFYSWALWCSGCFIAVPVCQQWASEG